MCVSGWLKKEEDLSAVIAEKQESLVPLREEFDELKTKNLRKNMGIPDSKVERLSRKSKPEFVERLDKLKSEVPPLSKERRDLTRRCYDKYELEGAVQKKKASVKRREGKMAVVKEDIAVYKQKIFDAKVKLAEMKGEDPPPEEDIVVEDDIFELYEPEVEPGDEMDPDSGEEGDGEEGAEGEAAAVDEDAE